MYVSPFFEINFTKNRKKNAKICHEFKKLFHEKNTFKNFRQSFFEKYMQEVRQICLK